MVELLSAVGKSGCDRLDNSDRYAPKQVHSAVNQELGKGLLRQYKQHQSFENIEHQA